jgi:transcriptional regulator with PAS, ATPase and Fis domain
VLKQLDVRLANALDVGLIRREVQQLRSKLGNLNEAGLIGRSPSIRTLLEDIRRVAQTPATTVLIEGETGTGKELVARAVHLASGRRNKRFLAINCAALSESLLEAELFGYERGSFSGASPSGKIGLFQAADGGTLLLDEIGEMSIGLQAKLLRVIQERQIRRVGGIDPVSIDVRIVASTNRNLQEEVGRGTFRNDLYYRLNVMLLRTPALRDRPTDIPILAQNFLDECLLAIPRPIRGFNKESMERLTVYRWPGNVRELKNVIERAVVRSAGPEITVNHLGLSEDDMARANDACGAGGDPLSDSGLSTIVCFGGADEITLTMVPGVGAALSEPTTSSPAGSAPIPSKTSAVTQSARVLSDHLEEPMLSPVDAISGHRASSLAVGDPDSGPVRGADEAADGHSISVPELSLASAERELIKLVLKKTGWNRSRAATILGINRTTLYDKLKLYDLKPPEKPLQGTK